MKKLLNFKNSLIMLMAALLCLSGLIGCSSTSASDGIGQALNIIEQVIDSSNKNNIVLNNPTENSNESNININNIPAYSGNDYIVLNNNVPNFSDSDLTTTSFEEYSPLDNLGRCGVAYANIGTDLMPTEGRESISSVKPSGWQSIKYDIVEGKYLYNRSHLIGFQLTAENANKNNLITGTRYFNATLMLHYENMVADYVKETNNHVLYRVTPIYTDENLLADGVLMEAESVEDKGKGISYCVYVYNVQPGIKIDYETGDSSAKDSRRTGQSSAKGTYIINENTNKFHKPDCRSVKMMKDKNKKTYTGKRSELINSGYEPCKNCNP